MLATPAFVPVFGCRQCTNSRSLLEAGLPPEWRPYNVLMDHHAVAAVSLIGICLDVLGGLYLAYDLLGAQHGPLRLLTRVVTYSIVFGLGYGIGLGFFFGLAAGAATGLTVAIDLQRTAYRQDHYSLPWEALFSAIRRFAFSAGLYRMVGIPFAIAFGVLITAGQVLAYSRGMRPGLDYAANRKRRLTRRQFWRRYCPNRRVHRHGAPLQRSGAAH